MELNVYLSYNGNCEEAMNFYCNALGGTIVAISRFGDSPMPVGEGHKNKVLHGILHACGTTMYFSDCGESRSVNFGDNFSVSLNFKSEAEIDATFATISAGGVITMPLQDTFWGAKFGMCCDKFGVNWMFNYDRPKTQE